MFFFRKPFPHQYGDEVKRLTEELAGISRHEDFLSERPGGGFDMDCRHIRTREIGTRLNEIGGADTMDWVVKKIAKRCGNDAGDHLEAAWARIGQF